MTLAYDYPLLGLFWTFIWFYALVVWFTILFHVIVDIFRSQELRGIAKASWLLIIFFVPIIGVIAYMVVRGGEMAGQRAAA